MTDTAEDTALADKILAKTLQCCCNVAAMLLQPALSYAAWAVGRGRMQVYSSLSHGGRARRSEQDHRWEELRNLLLEAQPGFDA